MDVRGLRPKCIWIGVIFNVLCGVCLINITAKHTLSSKFILSCRLVLVKDLIVRIVLSTNPVPVCRFGVDRIRCMFSPLQ